MPEAEENERQTIEKTVQIPEQEIEEEIKSVDDHVVSAPETEENESQTIEKTVQIPKQEKEEEINDEVEHLQDNGEVKHLRQQKAESHSFEKTAIYSGAAHKSDGVINRSKKEEFRVGVRVHAYELVRDKHYNGKKLRESASYA